MQKPPLPPFDGETALAKVKAAEDAWNSRATFGARENISVALRVQHTSNGGLSNTNPGLDMIGLSFAFNLSD